MARLPTLEGLYRDPFAAATRRLTLTLTLDRPVLRLLHRAAEQSDALVLATYGWALLAAEGVRGPGPQAAVAALDEAVDLDRDHAAWQFASALANAGGFGRRRNLPVAARRAFTAAARLDPGNLLPRLGVVAAKLSAGDRAAAVAELSAAAEATAFVLYRSPLGDELDAAAPWLGQDLALLWPGRVVELLRFVADSLLRSAGRAAERGRDGVAQVAPLTALGRRLVALGPDRPAELTLAAGVFARALAAQGELAGDAAAQRHAAAVWAALEQLRAARREVARGFERAVRQQVAAAGLGAAGGVGTVAYGLLRSLRRWPPPFPAALAGRHIAWLGVGATAASLAAIGCPNPALRAWRRRVEWRLVEAEAGLCRAARQTMLSAGAESEEEPPPPA